MKYILVILILTGCSLSVNGKDTRPGGEDIFGILLSNLDVNLENEPLCKAKIKLAKQLALSLSVSYESPNVTKISSSCSPSKFETPANEVIDIWDCTIRINEDSPKGEFISSSTYVFGISQDKNEFVNGSLRCR